MAVGVTMGIGLAVVVSAPLQLVLYKVDARDPIVFGAIVLTLLVTGVAASFIPARRVSRVDPVTALRVD